MQRRDLFVEVSGVVARALELRASASELTPQTSLIELGMDSLKAVDLAVALEEALGVAEFPIQEWADAEALHEGAPFTLGSLVSACAALPDLNPNRFPAP